MNPPSPVRDSGRRQRFAGWLSAASLLTATLGGVERAAPLGSGLEGDFMPAAGQLQSVSAVVQNSKGEWLLAPIPSLVPGQGYGLQLAVARIYQPAGNQATTPPSVLGVAGLYNEQKSFALGGGYLGHLADDLWRVTAGGGYVRFNSDFYGIGSSQNGLDLVIPIEQKAVLGLGQLMRRLRPGLYAGLRTLVAHTEVIVHGPVIPPIQLPDLVVKADMYAVSPVLQWDTRDNTFAPAKGTLLDARVDVFSGGFHFRSTTLAVNHYQACGEKGVLAWRGYAQVIDGNAPFFALCSFGQGSDLRGYTSGQHRDHAMVAVQAEYRLRLSPRWGVVAFAGAGQVGPSLGSLATDRLLTSAGGGLRFQLTKSNPVNLRCDYAWGRGSHALYIGVGEAF